MSIERPDFDNLSEADLRELIDAQVPEGLRLEYKSDTYGSSDAEKREFLKDVSAFANASGGHIILGMKESSGYAVELDEIVSKNIDSELVRLEQISRSGIEPRISGIRMKGVPLHSGGHAVIIRVPRSWNVPHRVVLQGANRFYLRHSAGVHEPDVEELRVLFQSTSSALNQARQFRFERVKGVKNSGAHRPLVGGGRLLVHIAPVAAFSHSISLDLRGVHARFEKFRPIGTLGMSPRFNYYGFINERGGEKNHGYTQVYRNGIVEATKSKIVNDREDYRFIPGKVFERNIFEVLPSYIVGLRDIGVPPPIIVMITLEGVLGAEYKVVSDRWADAVAPLPEDVLALPECVLPDYGDEIELHRTVKPAFDALWNAIGYSEARFFDDEGRWTGDFRRDA